MTREEFLEMCNREYPSRPPDDDPPWVRHPLWQSIPFCLCSMPDGNPFCDHVKDKHGRGRLIAINDRVRLLPGLPENFSFTGSPEGVVVSVESRGCGVLHYGAAGIPYLNWTFDELEVWR